MASSSSNSRFADITSVEEFIEGQENENTRKKTEQNVALLKARDFAFFTVFIFSSTLLKKVVMEVTVPHCFGLSRPRSDRKLNFRK